MAHHPSIRAKAIEWRTQDNLTIDQLADRLGVSRNTIYYWVKDIPIIRVYRSTPGQRKGNRTMQDAWYRKRLAAYDQGAFEFPMLCLQPTFRDFVCMYIAEGFKRNRNRVSIANSDACVILLGARWIRRFASNPIQYSVQYHADQDLRSLQEYWGGLLKVGPDEIKLQRKSNSNQLAGRKWRSQWGVLSVGSNDTYLRARLQAWMDLVEDSWV